MKKLLVFLIVIMLGGNAFAQTSNTSRMEAIFAAKEAFWNKVDTTTNWGKYLMSTKPYWDKIIEADRKNAISIIQNGDAEELLVTQGRMIDINEEETKRRSLMEDYHKAIQSIIPPDELKAMHAIKVEGSALAAKSTPTGNKQIDDQVLAELKKLAGKERNELNKVFKQHGVPQNIIDGFLKS